MNTMVEHLQNYLKVVRKKKNKKRKTDIILKENLAGFVF